MKQVLIYQYKGRQYTLQGREIDKFLTRMPLGIHIIAFGCQEG